jgi:pyrroloquinoline quinone biosynthesis protein B
MRIRILGSAAGGRFPQWNCGCENCVAVRESARRDLREDVRQNVPQNKFNGKARTQAQLALSADGSRWFLAGASPDLAFQIEATPELHPRALRDSPIAGVVLGSADLDHIIGLLLLRELQPLRVYAAPSILRILREENSMFGMLNRVDPQVVWTPMNAGTPFPLLDAAGEGFSKDAGLRCEVYYLSGRYPKYVKSSNLAPDEATAVLWTIVCCGRSKARTCCFSTARSGAMMNWSACKEAARRRTIWDTSRLKKVSRYSRMSRLGAGCLCTSTIRTRS